MSIILAVIVVVGTMLVAGRSYLPKFKIVREGKVIEPTTPPELDINHPPAPNELELSERWMYEQEHIIYKDRPGAERNEAFAQHVNCRICGPGILNNGQVPSTWPHDWYGVESITHYGSVYGSTRSERNREKVVSPSQADVVSSEILGHPGWHTPMIDIDFPTHLVASSTPGHYHLYIDKPITWKKYEKILEALNEAGIVEDGFLKESKLRKRSLLRPPWKEKQYIA